MQPAKLEEFRKRLIEQRELLLSEFRHLGETVTEDVNPEGDLSHVPTHPADRDSEGMDAKIAIERTEGELLNQVNLALRRIDEGTFGRCQECGDEISDARLDAIPHAAHCVQCEKRGEAKTTN